MPRKDSLVNASNAQAQQDTAAMGIEAYELPKSVVTKLARSAVRRFLKSVLLVLRLDCLCSFQIMQKCRRICFWPY